ncbi:MAG: hypothetical protein ACO29X_03890 [Arcobacteraceae bacterium]|jgi:hypothetical protein
MEDKQLLIKEILELINHNNNSTQTDINPNYLDFFEIDDLIETRDGLIKSISNFKENNNDYLDEIFSKCS